MKIYHAGQRGHSGFGWATCNNALISEFERMGILGDSKSDVYFVPILDHDLNPCAELKGKINIGYCFFEGELGPRAAENAARFNTVFCGSTWCLDRLRERSIRNGSVLIQGADSTIFSPQPPRKPDGQFRIFSGGKFEHRKGQDLVIAAFREFAKERPEAHLVCAWFNPWPQLIHSIKQSNLIRIPAINQPGRLPPSQEEWMEWLMEHNRIAPSQFTILPQLSQTDLAREMANTDCGLFPNRCEGGTNLVLMEYASLGRVVIANHATGHADIAEAVEVPIFYTEDAIGRADQKVQSVLDSMNVARTCVPHGIHEWTWAGAAQTVADEVARLTA